MSVVQPHDAHAGPREGVARTAAGPIHFRVDGAGQPILLIAGWSCDMTVWDALVPHLAARYQVIRFDNRGTGRSAHGQTPPTSIADLTADALAVLGEVGVRRAHVVGHSMGGQVAQCVALASPARVASLTLLSTWDTPDARFRWLIRLFGELASTLEPAAYVRMILPWMFTPAAFAASDLMEAAVRQWVDNPLRPAAAVLRAQAAACLTSDTSGALARLAVPTLVSVAAEDGLTPPSLSRQLAARIRGAMYRPLESGAHAYVLESAGPLAEVVLPFVAAHPV